MVQGRKDSPDVRSAAAEDFGMAKDRAREEARVASDMMSDAERAFAEKTKHLGTAARDEVSRRGDEFKDETAEGLHSFAEAIRSAGDELQRKQPGMVADLVREAAGGLEALSKNLSRRSVSDMIDGVRNFGRQNPTAFIAGSILAGFALGRFAGSSASHPHHSAMSDDTMWDDDDMANTDMARGITGGRRTSGSGMPARDAGSVGVSNFGEREVNKQPATDGSSTSPLIPSTPTTGGFS